MTCVELPKWQTATTMPVNSKAKPAIPEAAPVGTQASTGIVFSETFPTYLEGINRGTDENFCRHTLVDCTANYPFSDIEGMIRAMLCKQCSSWFVERTEEHRKLRET